MSKLFYLVIVSAMFLMCVGQADGWYNSSCPHPTFVQKHLCRYCQTPEDALEFSKSRTAKNIHINTVLFGDPGFEKIGGQYCQNIDRVQIYNCYLKRDICYPVGSRCLTKHHISTGHLYYKEMDCWIFLLSKIWLLIFQCDDMTNFYCKANSLLFLFWFQYFYLIDIICDKY